MKLIYLAFFFVFINASAQTEELLGAIRGNPKEYKETFYKAKKTKTGFIKGEFLYEKVYVKDSNNEFVEYSEFPSEEKDSKKNIYNKDNQKIESIFYDDEGKVVGKTKFVYLNKNLIEEKFYREEKYEKFIKYDYENDLLVKKTEAYLEDDGSINSSWTYSYEYDANKNIIKETYLNGIQNDVYTYKYNEKNFPTEIYGKITLNHDKEPRLYNKSVYQKYDDYNWTGVYFQDINSDNKIEINYIEREFKY
ncbi:hypothetical protein [Flavobacterium sp. DG2-3]|uniref:hypothetical protein n=1 Tax=Flavobacterium sp. DG2-3 TaxID=3068317 RepID=UPI00273E6F75|nr:hypothetical protein [Flavobacterium sp. DG2-3]MDP5198889.1 hypothetical protein [Flavobacterium sp. DG2-3]